MGCHDKLNSGECFAQARKNRLLPRRMEVHVHFVNEDDSAGHLRRIGTEMRVQSESRPYSMKCCNFVVKSLSGLGTWLHNVQRLSPMLKMEVESPHDEVPAYAYNRAALGASARCALRMCNNARATTTRDARGASSTAIQSNPERTAAGQSATFRERPDNPNRALRLSGQPIHGRKALSASDRRNEYRRAQ